MTASMPKNIAFIGPIEPFRSGVAKHSTQVALELVDRNNVKLTVYSFARLYPKVLFPGDDDRDEEASSPAKLEVKFWLDSINPITWRKVVRDIVHNNIEVVIIPAWTFFVAPCLGWVSKSLKSKGIEVVCIVHNAFDHEAGTMKNKLMCYQLSNSSRFICHNQPLVADLESVINSPRVVVTPHPIFDQYPESKKIMPKRSSLELLFFGIIRPYKGLDLLLSALAILNKDVDFSLSVVGECWGDINEYRELSASLGISEKVDFVDRYVSDIEAAEYFNRADAVVLPYRSMTGTGVIPLAYHYEKPVVTTNLEAFKEVVMNNKTGIIAESDSASSIAKAIKDVVVLLNSESTKKEINKIKTSYTWRVFVEKIFQVETGE